MEKSKKYWIDYLRIFAMFCVISVHMSNVFYMQYGKISAFDWWTANILNGGLKGYVCLFPMIAGALLLNKHYDLKAFYTKRALRLILPCLFWTVFYLVVRTYRGEDLSYLIKDEVILLGAATPHLWFFNMYICLMLFVPFVNFFIIGKKPEQKELKLLLLIILGFFTFNQVNVVLTEIKGFSIEWFGIFTWFIGYLLAGYYIDTYADKIKKSVLFIVLAITALSLIGIAINFISCQKLNIINDAVFFDKTGVVIFLRCMCVFYLFRKFFNYIQSTKLVTALSEASFGIYLIHPFIADLVKGAFPYQHAGKLEHYSLYLPFLIIAVFVLSFLIIHLIRKVSISKYIM